MATLKELLDAMITKIKENKARADAHLVTAQTYTDDTIANYIESGSWTPVCHNIEISKIMGDYIRVGDMVTVNFYFQGFPPEANTEANMEDAEIYITGLPYAPVNDGRAWTCGGGHLQRYYPYYTEDGNKVKAIFTGYALAPSSSTSPVPGDDGNGVIYARGATENGRAAYMLGIYQDSEIPTYGGGSITYKTNLTPTLNLDWTELEPEIM